MNNFYENKDLRKMTTGVDLDAESDKIIDESDKLFLEYLVRMGQSMSGDKIDLLSVKDSVEALEMLKKGQEHEYMTALLRPEKSRGAKIPSQIPIPSSSFQLKQSVYVSTNALGNASIICNPFFLAGSGTDSTFFVNNNAALTGSGASNFYTAVALGQVIPNVYNQYRLVSASIVAKYVGRLDIVQGLIAGAIVFDQNVTNTAVGSVNANIQKYGDYNLAQDAYFWNENFALKGIRELYFPLDNAFEEYYNTGTAKTGFAFIINIQQAPPSTTPFKIDVYFNFECLPDVTFLNYIPTSICSASTSMKDVAVREAQKRAVTTEEGYQQSSDKEIKGNFWKGLIGKFGQYLPSVYQLASNVLPQLKSVGFITPMLQQLSDKSYNN